MSFTRWLDHMKKTRRRDSRGAALVEAAIVMVPLCIIIFGIIEFGFIFKDSLSISNATRAGARTASAEPQATNFVDDTMKAVSTAGNGAGPSVGDKLWIYKADPTTGNFTGGTCSTDCAVYTWNGSNWGTTPVGNWPATDQHVCLGGTIDSVGVKLQISHHSITGFFSFFDHLNGGQGMKLTEKTVMRLEPQASSSSGTCT